ncbi:MAG: hypothetical protein Q4C60_07615 [Eubacteriales bacterium]|nr:hypothetical protein [Eubacteriales bacterium]
MEITKREIIVSVAIVSIMLIFGFFISGAITDYQNEKNTEYQKAIHIQDTELFQQGMNTNIGNAFVYGDLEAVEPVKFEEIGGNYMYVRKVEEHYTMHTRTVTTTDSKGRTHTTTQVYWQWDYAGKEEITCKEIKFCNVIFDTEKICLPEANYLQTINQDSNIRFKYYGVDAKLTGTIYTRLSDGTISNNSDFFEDKTPEEALEICISGAGNVVFWIFWIFLICAMVAGFYYADNKWLET